VPGAVHHNLVHPTVPDLLIRPSVSADLPAITAIYADSVLHGSASFELDPPDLPEMTRRRDDVLAMALPWLVAERRGTVLGYAYASPFRPRPAYRFSLEDSVYVAEAARGQGLGRWLLAELLARCEARGARQMLAVIGDANPASVALHAALGFAPAGVLRSVGWKFEHWCDVVLMQIGLGLSDRCAADQDRR
jgi:L-amino acid N-acyltransferase YncA